MLWRSVPTGRLAVADALSGMLAPKPEVVALPLPDRGPTLIVVSDYSQSAASPFECVSFLVVDLMYLWLWDDLRERARERHLRDRRRLAYKALGDKRRRAALPSLLAAADCLPGILLTVGIEDSVFALFSGLEPVSYPAVDLRAWRKRPLNRLSVIAQIAATLVAGYAAPGQNVLWFSDQDEILANEKRLAQATKVFACYLNELLPARLGHVRLGTTASDDGSLMIEDLASIPDIAAGAVADILRGLRLKGPARGPRPVAPMPTDVTGKASRIASWLALQDRSLARRTGYVRSTGGSGYVTASLLLEGGPWQNTMRP